MRLPIQVQCIIYRKANDGYEYLILKRTPERGGWWQTVTGGVEDSDINLRSTCIREIAEEISVKKRAIINITDEIYLFQYYNDGIMYSEYVYGFEVDPETEININNNIYPEHTEFKWVSLNKALKYLEWKSNKIAFTKLSENISKQ